MRDGWTEFEFSDFLAPVRRKAAIDPQADYKMVTLPLYGRGARLRKVVRGADLGSSKFEVRTGDLMISKIDARKGSNSLLPTFLDGAIVTGDFLSYKVDESIVTLDFFDTIVRSPMFSDLCDTVSAGTTNRVRLDVSRFITLRIAIPLLAEQRRIVDLIGALDEAIKAADESADALGNVYLALLGKVNNSDFELRLLEGVLSKAKAGGTPSRRVPENYGGSIPWLKSGEVENDSITTASEFITVSALASSSAWLAPAGSTVVAMYGQGDTKGKAGYLLGPVAMNQAVIALVPNKEFIDDRYLFHIMRSKTVNLRKKAVGAAQPNLSKNIVVNEEIPLPPLGAQSKIAAMLDSALDSKRLSDEYASSLRNLRTNLLTVLLSGDHTIPASYDDLLAEAM